MDLASSTLPATHGSLELTGVVSDSIPLTLDTSTALSTTGALTYSSIRPILTGVVSVSIPLTLDTSTALSTTGVFTYSAIRPILTGVVSQKVNPAGTSSGATSPPSTRQILIR